MPIPTYGAAPLSKSFVVIRGLQVVSMIIIVGITANFISEIVGNSIEAPKEVVATLSVTCIAALYCLVSIAFFWSDANMGLFVMTGLDFALLITFIVVAVTLGKPVSFLNCARLPNSSVETTAASAYAFTSSISNNWGKSGSTLAINVWVGMTKANCYETKALWGISIALCVLFATSFLVLPALWFKNKKANSPPKGEV